LPNLTLLSLIFASFFKIIDKKSDSKFTNKDGIKKKNFKGIDNKDGSDRPKKFKSERPNSTPSSTQASKTAKFSSLFKNNHEIPKVGE
jgi:hypothetical protein